MFHAVNEDDNGAYDSRNDNPHSAGTSWASAAMDTDGGQAVVSADAQENAQSASAASVYESGCNNQSMI